MASMFKKDWHKLRIINRPCMLLTFEDGTTGGRCNAIHRYAKANNKCMKNYNKNVESLFIEYLDANNVYGCLKNYLLENLNG